MKKKLTKIRKIQKVYDNASPREKVVIGILDAKYPDRIKMRELKSKLFSLGWSRLSSAVFNINRKMADTGYRINCVRLQTSFDTGKSWCHIWYYRIGRV